MGSVYDRREAVVISGIGAFTPFGVGWGSVDQALRAGRRAAERAGDKLPGASDCHVGLVRDDLIVFRQRFPEILPPFPVPLTRTVMVAAADALDDSRLLSGTNPDRVGLILNRNRGAASVVAEVMEPVLRGGPRKMRPLLFSQTVANAPLGAIATEFRLRGPHLLTNGGGAVLLALDALRRGDADAILCGGFDEVDANSTVAGAANGTLRPYANPEEHKPYDARSSGTTLTEGAVILVLERADNARTRNATILAELSSAALGLAVLPDALEPKHLVGWGRPSPDAVAAVIRDALTEAHVAPREIGWFAGGGNGVPVVDAAERGALEHLGLTHVPLRSLKGHLGEGLGMAAAASIAWAAQTVAHGDAGYAALVTNLEFEAHCFAAVLKRVVH